MYVDLPAPITEQLPPPDWAEWVATDSDGYKCYHENKPTIGVDRWTSSGKSVMVGSKSNPTAWEDSLMRIQRFVNDNVKF